MKHKKGIILITIVLAISVFATGCVDKVSDKIGSKIGEKVLEKALGEDVKLDSKDNSMSIETKDGSYKFGEGLDWPKDKLDPLPVPDAEIVSVSDQSENQSVSVMMHFSNRKKSVDYLEQVRSLGFIEGSITTSNDHYSYMGYKESDNIQLSVSSQGLDDDVTLVMITLSKDNDNSRDFFTKLAKGEPELDLTGIDMTDGVPWPKDKLGKIPGLSGKITGTNITNENVYVGLSYVKKEDLVDFIEKVKNLGFTENASETISLDHISYMGEDDKGYSLSVMWFNHEVNLNYIFP